MNRRQMSKRSRMQNLLAPKRHRQARAEGRECRRTYEALVRKWHNALRTAMPYSPSNGLLYPPGNWRTIERHEPLCMFSSVRPTSVTNSAAKDADISLAAYNAAHTNIAITFPMTDSEREEAKRESTLMTEAEYRKALHNIGPVRGIYGSSGSEEASDARI